jgi:hypothetical protein
MRYPLELEGFEGHTMEVSGSGFIQGPRLYFDGRPAKRGPGKLEYLLTRNDGIKVKLTLRQTVFDNAPHVIFEGEKIRLAEPLRPIEGIWCALPLLLIFFGGMIGGGLGAAAFWLNTRVFGMDMSVPEKYLLTGLISAIAVFLWLIFGGLIGGWLFT